MAKRALLVARVSSTKQQDNYSPETQIEEMSNYARYHGFEDVRAVKDVISGTVPIYDRPGGKEIHNAIHGHSIDAVIFYTFDRASRDDDAIDFMILRRDLRQAGIELHIVKEGGKLGDDYVSGLLAYLGVTRAGQERKAILERTARGRNGKAKSGQVVGCGKPSLGYDFTDGKLEIVETEATLVRLIFEWYIRGDETGKRLSTRGLAARLTEMGVPTPSEMKGYKRRKRAEGAWGEDTIGWILKNETYCGVWHYGKWRGSGGRGGKRDERETIAVEVPAIISREVWEAAQEQMKQNNRYARRNCKANYLLRGMIICKCGRRMIGTCGWYRCVNCYSHVNRCDEAAIRCEVIEIWAWDFMLEALTDPERFETEWRKAQQAELESLAPKQSRLEAVQAMIAQSEAEADEVANALKKARGVVAQRLEVQADDLNKRYTNLIAERDKIEAELQEGLVYTDEALHIALQFRTDALAGLQSPTFDNKRNYLEWLQFGANVKDGKVLGTCLLPITGQLDLRLPDKNNPGDSGGQFALRTSSSMRIR